ncbi:MAG: cytochrome c [Nitrospiraceae bacterium]|nr:cytochrome c [Nitrospiraceae bacterium]
MKTALSLALALFAAIAFSSAALAKGPSGAALFQKNCAMCHSNGGNVMKPGYSLHKKDMKTNAVKSEADIVKLIRHPGPGMPAFNEDKLSDAEANAIAKYIMKTWNK